MKTVLVTLEFPPSVGGVENYYYKLSANWPDEFIVVDNHNNELLYKNLPFLKWLKAVKAIFNILRRTTPDWLIIGEILPLGTASWIVSLFIKHDYCIVLHGLDFALATKSSYKRWLSKKILLSSKIIICANSYTAGLVNDLLKNKKTVSIVNPGIDKERPLFRQSLASSLRANYGMEKDVVLISIGRLVERKGFADVISVLPQVMNEIPNLAYVIVGSGPEENKLRSMSKDLSLKGKVFFMPGASDEEKWAWLDTSDIFIMPSKNLNGDYEGFGIVYLEANLFGKPVIAADNGGVKDAVVDHLNGLLIQTQNLESLALAIKELATNSELRTTLGKQGQNRAINDFNWSKQTSLFYDNLKKIYDFNNNTNS